MLDAPSRFWHLEMPVDNHHGSDYETKNM